MSVVSLLGVLLFVFGHVLWLALLGSVLWGFGLSLGFPVGMSAGADEPRMAAPRVSVVASIGYCAFLAGPPVVGLLGDHVTVLRSVSAVAVLLALAILLAGNVAPLGPAEDPD
jgi:MFS family permease